MFPGQGPVSLRQYQYTQADSQAEAIEKKQTTVVAVVKFSAYYLTRRKLEYKTIFSIFVFLKIR